MMPDFSFQTLHNCRDRLRYPPCSMHSKRRQYDKKFSSSTVKRLFKGVLFYKNERYSLLDFHFHG